MAVIYDRGQMTNENKDPALMATIRELSGMLSDFYAERLAKMYVLHVGWFYRMMFKMAKPMIAKKTRNKMEVLGNPSDLLQFIDRDQLSPEYGGTSSYVHPWPAN